MTIDVMSSVPKDVDFWSQLEIELRAVQQIYSRIVEAYDLTVIEWQILRELMKQDCLPASKLAKRVGRVATSFTPTIDKLQIKRLVERRSDSNDRRVVCIQLTSQGREMAPTLQSINHTIEKYMQARIRGTEAQLLQSILQRMQTSHLP